MPSWRHSFFSLIQATISISLLAYLNSRVAEDADLVLLVASFGATAVLIHSEIKSPLAQPYNCILGQITSAFVGVCMHKVRRPPSTLHTGPASFHNGKIGSPLDGLLRLVKPDAGPSTVASLTVRCLRTPGSCSESDNPRSPPDSRSGSRSS